MAVQRINTEIPHQRELTIYRRMPRISRSSRYPYDRSTRSRPRVRGWAERSSNWMNPCMDTQMEDAIR